MFGKLALAILVGVMLLQAPFPAAAAQCCSNTDLRHTSIDDGCCATVGCCVLSRNTAENQLTPAPIANELSSLSTQANLVSLLDLPIRPSEARFDKVRPLAHSPPRLALLCTRLI